MLVFFISFFIISNLSSSQIKTGFLHVCEVHTEKPCVWGVNKNNQELVVIKSTILNHSKLLVHINYLQFFAYIKTWKTLNNIPFVQTMVKPPDLFYFTNSYSLHSSPFNPYRPNNFLFNLSLKSLKKQGRSHAYDLMLKIFQPINFKAQSFKILKAKHPYAVKLLMKLFHDLYFYFLFPLKLHVYAW